MMRIIEYKQKMHRNINDKVDNLFHFSKKEKDNKEELKSFKEVIAKSLHLRLIGLSDYNRLMESVDYMSKESLIKAELKFIGLNNKYEMAKMMADITN